MSQPTDFKTYNSFAVLSQERITYDKRMLLEIEKKIPEERIDAMRKYIPKEVLAPLRRFDKRSHSAPDLSNAMKSENWRKLSEPIIRTKQTWGKHWLNTRRVKLLKSNKE